MAKSKFKTSTDSDFDCFCCCIPPDICRLPFRTSRSLHSTLVSVGGLMHKLFEVHAGDFKMTNMPSLVATFYTPLRYVELGVWKIVKPTGSSC